MKLLLDENLSPRLAEALADIFPGTRHVHHCGLGSESDSAVWTYAKANSYAIVSKDSDFAERAVLDPAPPKIIWLHLGNCSTAEVESILRSAAPAIRTFIEAGREVCLLLTRDR